MRGILLLLLMFTQSAFGFEFEGGQITIPQSYEGPITRDMRGQGTVYGFRKIHKDGMTGALLQITVLDPGQKFPALSQKELKEGAAHYLLQLLAGVERRRNEFNKTKIEFIEISGIPTAKISWSGLLSSNMAEGVMYCYIHNSKIISLHAQDFKEYKGKNIYEAIDAFENIKIN